VIPDHKEGALRGSLLVYVVGGLAGYLVLTVVNLFQ